MWYRKTCLSGAFLLTFLVLSGALKAQEITQTIRGVVVDQTTRQPLAGASVSLIPVEGGIGTSTDEEGKFEIKNVPVGRHAISVSYTGYKTEIVRQLLVNSGKETILTVGMEQAPYQLEEVRVTAGEVADGFERLGKIDISSEQFQRIAANYLDPARVVMSSPSIANTNDQNNAISVRGNSPVANTWRLEGVEIVNPNHLANAGTISDRPTQNGGGVNVLSTQMLDNSAFLMGYMPAGYGNAIGGIFDMNFRHGNNQQREYTAQASVIGLDFAAEGPFKEGGSASYLVNYRYSFTGILSAMGINFGGEAIKFQDLSFNISAPETPLGKLTFFGVNGWNSNVYRGPGDPAEWQMDKDLADIDYISSIYAYGLTHETGLGKNSSWRNVVVYSSTDTERTQTTILPEFADSYLFNEGREKISKTSFASVIRRNWSGKVNTEGGFRGTLFGWNTLNLDSISSADPFFDSYVNARRRNDLKGLLLQPFISNTWQLSSRAAIDLGINSSWFDLSGEFVLEPRLALEWQSSPATSFDLRSGVYSQVLSPYAYHTGSRLIDPAGAAGQRSDLNDGLKFYKSWATEAGFKTDIVRMVKLGVDAFYQYQYDIPSAYLSVNGNDYYYSYMNYDGEDQLLILDSGGEGRTYGLSAEAKQQIINGFYVWTGGTLYRSEYKNQNGDYLPSRFDGRYNFNLTLGKEFQKKKSDQLQRLLGFHSRVFYQGGFMQQQLGTTWSGYDVHLGDYFRLDLRVQWTRFKPGYSQLFAIDVQNALGTKNPAYYYYDVQAGAVTLKEQLGVIPVILYRIDF